MGQAKLFFLVSPLPHISPRPYIQNMNFHSQNVDHCHRLLAFCQKKCFGEEDDRPLSFQNNRLLFLMFSLLFLTIVFCGGGDNVYGRTPSPCLAESQGCFASPIVVILAYNLTFKISSCFFLWVFCKKNSYTWLQLTFLWKIHLL